MTVAVLTTLTELMQLTVLTELTGKRCLDSSNVTGRLGIGIRTTLKGNKCEIALEQLTWFTTLQLNGFSLCVCIALDDGLWSCGAVQVRGEVTLEDDTIC